MNCNDCSGFLPRGCTCDPFGGRRSTLAAEVADAQRVVAEWSAEKRARVQLEGPPADGVREDGKP
jgi:hypothetical protein